MAAMDMPINLPRTGRLRMRADRGYEGRSIVMVRQSIVGCLEVAQIYTQPEPAGVGRTATGVKCGSGGQAPTHHQRDRVAEAHRVV
jgi:hypothetical protein